MQVANVMVRERVEKDKQSRRTLISILQFVAYIKRKYYICCLLHIFMFVFYVINKIKTAAKMVKIFIFTTTALHAQNQPFVVRKTL